MYYLLILSLIVVDGHCKGGNFFMQKIISLFKESCAELKNVKCVVLAAMFGAISIVLGALTVMVTEYLKIGFSFLPNQFIFYLFGPFVGGTYGAVMDILTFIVKPTGTFHPGFTLNSILSGIIYGLILYKKPVRIIRIVFANIANIIVVGLLLSTLWLISLTGMSFFAIFVPRLIKLLIMLPIETILFYSVLKAVEYSGVTRLIYNKRVQS